MNKNFEMFFAMILECFVLLLIILAKFMRQFDHYKGMVISRRDVYRSTKVPLKYGALQIYLGNLKVPSTNGRSLNNNKVIGKVRRLGGRERVSFVIIGHQMCNWE